MKPIILGGMAGVALAVTLAACAEIEGIDYLRLGHPADPDSLPGRVERMSNALVPENITPRPKLEAAKPAQTTKTKEGGSAMDHSTHRGSH